MRPLVMFYSLTGRTRRVAMRLGERLDAEVVEVSCPRYEGILGRIVLALDFLTRKNAVPTAPHTELNPARAVVVGGPVWGDRLSGPMRSVLSLQLRDHPHVMVFVTCGGMDSLIAAQAPLVEAAECVRHPLQAKVAVTGADMEPDMFESTVDRLVRIFSITGAGRA